MRLRILAALALLVASATTAHAIARWMDDAIDDKNNPPKKNAALPDATRKAIVRVTHSYQTGEGANTTTHSVYGTGTVIRLVRSGPTSDDGDVCVLTGSHNTEPSTGGKPYGGHAYRIGFGDGRNPSTIRFPAKRILRPPTPKGGRPPDLTLMGGMVTEWDSLPAGIGEPPLAAQVNDSDLVQAGYGNTAKVDVAGRKYTPEVKEFGTLRIGTNQVGQVTPHTTSPSPRNGNTFTYPSIESDMKFRPPNGAAKSADSYILGQDSGGPSFQQTAPDVWSVVGVHSESQVADGTGAYPEGRLEWDVRVADFKDWIEKACDEIAKKKPEPSKDKESEGQAQGGNVSYDADRFELSLAGGSLSNTGFPTDPILGASIAVPLLTNLGELGNRDQLFVSDSTTWLTVAQGPTTYLRARIPFVTYRRETNDLVAVLDDLRLANASPSDPFYDPTLVAPESPWIASLRTLLSPSSAGYDPARRLWFRLEPSTNLASASQSFSADAFSSALGSGIFAALDLDAVPRGTPEVSCHGAGTTRGFVVCNTSAIADTFSCSLADSRGWIVGGAVQTDRFLMPGECDSIDVTLDPGGCPADAADTLLWSASPKGSNEVFDLCDPITVDVGAVAAAGCPRDSVIQGGTYAVIRFALGNHAASCGDSIRYELSDTRHWRVTPVVPTGMKWLPAGTDSVLDTWFYIPATTNGVVDTVTWVASRLGFPAQSETCTVRLTVSSNVGVVDPQRPDHLMLASPVPNPASEAVLMRWALPRDGHARLSLLDVAGRTVRRLFDQKWAAGEHVWKWDGRAESGARAPSGIYLLILETDTERVTQRLTWIR